MSSELKKFIVDYATDAISTDAFVALWRTQGGALCEQLPPQYRRALDDMLMRVESSRLFSGDSCSFSRNDLLDVFNIWLEKGQQRLAEIQALDLRRNAHHAAMPVKHAIRATMIQKP